MISRRMLRNTCMLLPVLMLAAQCGREETPGSSGAAGSGAKSSKVLADRSPDTVPAEMAATKHRLGTALGSKDYKRGFGIVRELEEAGHYVEASDAMGEALQRMDPSGMPLEEVVEIIGEPDVKSEQELLYRFDNGYSGSLWALFIKEGAVSGFERRDID